MSYYVLAVWAGIVYGYAMGIYNDSRQMASWESLTMADRLMLIAHVFFMSVVGSAVFPFVVVGDLAQSVYYKLKKK